MKTRILIVMAAMFAMIMAVGCSNDQRVANPGELGTSELNNPGSNLEIAGHNNDNFGATNLRGVYFGIENSCHALLVGKKTIDLKFSMPLPYFVQDGVELEVSGYYFSDQNSKCELGPVFHVSSARLIGTGQDGQPNDNPGPTKVSGPVVLLGTFHRLGANCMYIQIDKDRTVELQLETYSPAVPQDGAIIQVIGFYSAIPSTPCNLGPLFIANVITELSDRYEPPADNGSVAGSLGPIPQVLLGTFRRLGTNCRYLEVDKLTSVELRFRVSSPNDPRDGDVVQVSGFYSSLPGSDCALGQVFAVDNFIILTDQYNPPSAGDQVMGADGPLPQAVIGRYYRMGASCEYIQPEKDLNIELRFQVDSPIDIKEGTLLLVTGHYSMLPSSQCGFAETFIVQGFSELSEQGEQTEDNPAPASSVPGGNDPISISGPAIYFGDAQLGNRCLYIEVSKTQLVELRDMKKGSQHFDVDPGTTIEASGHFLSNATSNCNLGPIFGATEINVYRNDIYVPNFGENEKP